MPTDFGTDKEKLSFKQIVLGHLKKISELSAVEFRGGYNKRIIKDDHVIKEHVPDSRAVYINAIEYFHDILSPQFDDKMKKVSKEYAEAKPEEKKEKLNNARELFQHLNLLLYRIDYLKSAIYEETE